MRIDNKLITVGRIVSEWVAKYFCFIHVRIFMTTATSNDVKLSILNFHVIRYSRLLPDSLMACGQPFGSIWSIFSKEEKLIKLLTFCHALVHLPHYEKSWQHMMGGTEIDVFQEAKKIYDNCAGACNKLYNCNYLQ